MAIISDKIRALLRMRGKTQTELAAFLGIRAQSLSNKMQRGSFSADDLIKIAEFTGAELAYFAGSDKIVLGSDCVRSDNQKYVEDCAGIPYPDRPLPDDK